VDHGDKIRNKIIGIMFRREGEEGVESNGDQEKQES
jgi:hypothetical protein